MRSGAAGKLAASGRAASGGGHARELGRHVRGLGKHWDTGDGETRWDAECVEMSRAEQATGKTPTICMGGVRAKASGTPAPDPIFLLTLPFDYFSFVSSLCP